ncbi:hypothetical protein PGTUg99_027241 [Puccinia graminis f. sp. tritici]|uniref:Uncharacterized protein n=1 Tax=Puccinia graminis f. sp. tritici TaxID=56615 RepID=A0A5B0Q1Q9_PUCGR|nr:hypothetical protein PGTUg99_000232 [Puccinia graminis f. sp. tritici]KAA1106758.1 hypothetical protein PGTUg99_023397 [Puccinia graminis f. sp. tritici]KAA1107052.1 hypothetical protein PGTUg99_027241 [Puccinia graminis f. sp. tritici]
MVIWPSWSKAAVLRSSIARCVGSNPTVTRSFCHPKPPPGVKFSSESADQNPKKNVRGPQLNNQS